MVPEPRPGHARWVDGPDLLGWGVTCMWLAVAAWVYFDARKHGMAAVSHAVATALLPGLGLAVYIGSRNAAARAADESLSPNGQRLLRELTAEVERLRAELATRPAP